MAACGAKVLHLRCVEYARRYNVPVHVRSSFSQKEGTWVVDAKELDQMEQAIISGVVQDRNEAKITVVGVPDKPGEAARIFETVAGAETNIDMIVQNVGGRHEPHRHLLHAARASTAPGRCPRWRG